MNSILRYLKDKRLIWQGDQVDTLFSDLNSTGYDELDAVLEGGFPSHGVLDIHSPVGIGELRLLLPALRARQHRETRMLVLIAPPVMINGEMLAEYGFNLEHVLILTPQSSQEALWSAEECLKSSCCNAVLLWQKNIEIHQVKRLNLAAEQGAALHIMMRPQGPSELSLPVSLGMSLTPHSQGIQVNVTKRKGGWSGQQVMVNMRQQWPALTRQPRRNNIVHFPRAHVS